MNTQRDIDRRLEGYLEGGPTVLPDRAYDAVRSRINQTRQRVLFGPWREERMRIAGRANGPTASLRLRPQLTWILAAALLAVALGGAIVVGAVLLTNKPPSLISPPPPTQSPAPSAVGSLSAEDDPLGGYCGNPKTLDQLVVRFEVHTSEPTQEVSLVRVLPDGTVLVGKRSEVRFGAGIASRRLTQSGLEKIANLVTDANLPNCQSITFGAPDQGGLLQVRSAGRDVRVSFALGSRAFRVRNSAPAEVAAMSAVAAQLGDLDGTLDVADWLDEAWQPYVPEQWKLMLQLMTSEDDECGPVDSPTTGPAPTPCLRLLADLKLPDGTPLLSFGTLYPGGYRCGLIDRQAAAELPEALRLAADSSGPYARQWDQAPTRAAACTLR